MFGTATRVPFPALVVIPLFRYKDHSQIGAHQRIRIYLHPLNFDSFFALTYVYFWCHDVTGESVDIRFEWLENRRRHISTSRTNHMCSDSAMPTGHRCLGLSLRLLENPKTTVTICKWTHATMTTRLSVRDGWTADYFPHGPLVRT